MRYERVDLNLFRVFDAIMSHRSVAGASRELGVTPSAVSHALTRLRKLLDDDLFLPSTDGMLPTPRAIELAPSIRDGLGSIARVLDARPFDPAKIVRAFGIAASHLPATVILPPLLARLLSQAPNASVRVFPMGRRDTVQQLDDGRLDLIIGWFETLPPRMRRQTLMWEQEAMVVRAGHPLTLQKVTRQRLFAFPHVVVEFTGSEDHANDGFIDERGVMRRIWIERLLVEASESGRRSGRPGRGHGAGLRRDRPDARRDGPDRDTARPPGPTHGGTGWAGHVGPAVPAALGGYRNGVARAVGQQSRGPMAARPGRHRRRSGAGRRSIRPRHTNPDMK